MFDVMSGPPQCYTVCTPSTVAEGTRGWTVQGYSWVKDKPTGEYLTSPVLFQGGGVEATLQFYPSGDKTSHESGRTAVYFCLKSMDDNQSRVVYKICLKSQCAGTNDLVQSFGYNDGELLTIRASKIKMRDSAPAGSRVGYDNFVSVKDINKYLKSDALHFELTYKVWSESSVAIKNIPLPATTAGQRVSLNTVAVDLGRLLADAKHTDIVLKVGDDRIRAHRLVLASRSPVFEQMLLESGMQESAKDGEVNMTDSNPDTVQAFLKALYTDEISPEFWDDSESLCHLLVMFHKYQVQPLVDRCEQQIRSSFSIENVAERLLMADLLNLQELHTSALSFMTSSPSQLAEVQATDGFHRLTSQRPQLLAQILATATPPAKRPRSDMKVTLPTNLEELTVVALKQLSSDYGLSASGIKSVLIERLRAHAHASR